MALLFVFGPEMFVIEELVTVRLSPEVPPDFSGVSVGYQKLAYVYITLIWMAIFAVKFSFLFFFKNLVRCIRSMTIYWCIVTVATGIVCAFGIAQPFISCPYFDLRSGESSVRASRSTLVRTEKSHSAMLGRPRSPQSSRDPSYDDNIGYRNRPTESVVLSP